MWNEKLMLTFVSKTAGPKAEENVLSSEHSGTAM
jgi:hypothetical protein